MAWNLDVMGNTGTGSDTGSDTGSPRVAVILRSDVLGLGRRLRNRQPKAQGPRPEALDSLLLRIGNCAYTGPSPEGN